MWWKRSTHGFGNEVGVFSVGGVPIASIEHSYHIIVDLGKTLEESNETMLVIDLGLRSS